MHGRTSLIAFPSRSFIHFIHSVKKLLSSHPFPKYYHQSIHPSIHPSSFRYIWFSHVFHAYCANYWVWLCVHKGVCVSTEEGYTSNSQSGSESVRPCSPLAPRLSPGGNKVLLAGDDLWLHFQVAGVGRTLLDLLPFDPRDWPERLRRSRSRSALSLRACSSSYLRRRRREGEKKGGNGKRKAKEWSSGTHG